MNTAVLFLIFNRPDTTVRTFETIRKARPPRLYVAADGPRKNKFGEKEKCEEVRSIVKYIDWNCEVKTLFRDDNLGCGRAVSGAITWFFEQEEEGIILEDDILPHPDFFLYCEELLERYRHVENVGFISGRNQLYRNIDSKESYTFISISHVWGWASWRRTWENYDYKLKNSSLHQFEKCLSFYYQKANEKYYWKWIYIVMKNNLIDTWDYQLTISLMLSHSLSIIPCKNMVQNIGFGEGATHTVKYSIKENSIKTFSIMPLRHPQTIFLDVVSDQIEIHNEQRVLSLWKYAYRKIKLCLKKIVVK